MRHSPRAAQKALLAFVANTSVKRGIYLVRYWLRTYGLPTTLKDLIHPVANKLSRLHKGRGSVSLTNCYVFNTIVEQAFLPFAESIETQTASRLRRGPVVLGNVEGDFHALGRKIVAALARLYHWKVIDLGTNVTAQEFVDVAIEHRATIVGVSAMTYASAKKIVAIRQGLCENGLEGRVRLAVGGAVFNVQPDLAKKVGSDGTASSALEAIRLFDQLDKPNPMGESVLTGPWASKFVLPILGRNDPCS